MQKTTLLLGLSLFFAPILQAQSKKTITSPNKAIQVEISSGKDISYRVKYRGSKLFEAPSVSLSLTDGRQIGKNASLKNSKVSSVNRMVKPLFGFSEFYADRYNQLNLNYGDFSVEFRVFDDAVAYRFVTRIPGRIKIKDEEVNIEFEDNSKAFFHKVSGFQNSYEQNYTYEKISDLDSGALTTLPILVDAKAKVLISEADLLDYPGLYLTGKGRKGLIGKFPAIVTDSKLTGWEAGDYDNNKKFVTYNKSVVTRTDYIAETSGSRSFPWRLMVIKDQEKDLMTSAHVYLLASESKIGNTDWIKPGKVAWDWWNAVNLSGVDFKAGYNTETFKYFIDFAARNNIKYVNLDEWWSEQDNLLKVTDKLDMPELVRYAKQKNVGLFLWCIWHVLDRQMPEAMAQFEKWGIEGLKVDFMDRDDQEVVNFYERLAADAAKRKILINYHGAMKPTGLERTYPNVINREAVLGLEYNKFSNKNTPEHNVTIPFIRMAVGPMDYTPGAMHNATKENWRQINLRPMSMTTRTQQLAMYVVYYAPLQMLADAPTEYEKEPVILNFLKDVPTTWDETIPLEGKPGEYVAIARKKGNKWYVGVLNNSTARKVSLSLPFLPAGSYKVSTLEDGINAHRLATDYKVSERIFESGKKLEINLAPAGGFVAEISK